MEEFRSGRKDGNDIQEIVLGVEERDIQVGELQGFQKILSIMKIC